MKRLLHTCLQFFCLILGVHAQTNHPVVTYPLTSNLNGTGEPGITVHPVVFGNGYHATNSTTGSLSHDFTPHCGCTGLRVWNWKVSNAVSLNAANAVSQNRYIEFSFTNNKGVDVIVNSFNFTASSGFTSNCSGPATYSYLRWMIDGVHSSPQWIRNTVGSCTAEQPLSIPANSCTSYARPNLDCSSGWSTLNPITVENGQRVRFRVYIATSNDQTSWRVGFSNVVINRVSPLAVNLSSFNANCASNETRINWSTESEQNASHFDLERSNDGETWDNVTTVLANGNSTTIKTYSVDDNIRSTHGHYYRLIQVDFDGRETVYSPIYVKCRNENGNNLLVYPNPSSGTFSVAITASDVLENAVLVVTDLNGKEVATHELIGTIVGTSVVQFADKNLANGTYLVTLQSNSNTIFTPTKLVLQ